MIKFNVNVLVLAVTLAASTAALADSPSGPYYPGEFGKVPGKFQPRRAPASPRTAAELAAGVTSPTPYYPGEFGKVPGKFQPRAQVGGAGAKTSDQRTTGQAPESGSGNGAE